MRLSVWFNFYISTSYEIVIVKNAELGFTPIPENNPPKFQSERLKMSEVRKVSHSQMRFNLPQATRVELCLHFADR